MQLYKKKFGLPKSIRLIFHYLPFFHELISLIIVHPKMSKQETSKPSVVFGAAMISSFAPEVLDSFLKTLEEHSVKELDTARIYV